jgi:hypothetical protein
MVTSQRRNAGKVFGSPQIVRGDCTISTSTRFVNWRFRGGCPREFCSYPQGDRMWTPRPACCPGSGESRDCTDPAEGMTRWATRSIGEHGEPRRTGALGRSRRGVRSIRRRRSTRSKTRSRSACGACARACSPTPCIRVRARSLAARPIDRSVRRVAERCRRRGGHGGSS